MFVSSVSSGLRVQRTNAQCRTAVVRTFSQPHRMTIETSKVFRGSQSRSMAAEQLCTRAATESEAATTSTDDKTWYALVANAEFMLNEVQNEAFAEQLREKARFYTEKEMKRDFFLVCDPLWLDEQHGEKAKAVGRPCVALIAKDKVWITFMKLRLDRVLMLEVAGTEEEITKCGGPVPKFGTPARWTAPYARYAEGWWEAFMPGLVE